MKYTIDKQEKYSLLRLHEEKLDSSVAPGLKSELITLHAEGVKNIVLDLAEVKYTDSSGLSRSASNGGPLSSPCSTLHSPSVWPISSSDCFSVS